MVCRPLPRFSARSPAGRALFNEYMETKTVPLAYEMCWSQLTPEIEESFRKIHETGSKLWINTIWGSLCGYLDDDKALD
jgi:glycerophosphoryl diester phosphodiesterase